MGTLIVGQTAIAEGGNPDLIIRGYDVKGDICGVSDATVGLPYTAWPYAPEYTVRVCVASCSETKTDARMSLKHSSTPFLTFCLPFDTTDASNQLVSFSSEWGSYWETTRRAFVDIKAGWPVIAGSVAIALVVSFVYVLFLRGFAGVMVWTLIAASVGVMIAATVFVYDEWQRYKVIDPPQTTTADQLQILFWVLVVADVIFVLIILSLRKSIQVAIEVIKEAGRALMSMPFVIFFPFFPL